MARASSDEETDDRVALAQEHRENARRRLDERGRSNTIDASDPTVGWTAQSGTEGAWNDATGVWDSDPNQNQPGQVFHVSQLPDPEVARAAGIPPQNIPPNLVVEDEEEAYTHPQGPSATELRNAAQREAILNKMREDVEAREEVRRHVESGRESNAVVNAAKTTPQSEKKTEGDGGE